MYEGIMSNKDSSYTCTPLVAVCYSVLQCVAVCCSVLQCVAVCCASSCTHLNTFSGITAAVVWERERVCVCRRESVCCRVGERVCVWVLERKCVCVLERVFVFWRGYCDWLPKNIDLSCSRLPKNRGLFCERALSKRRYHSALWLAILCTLSNTHRHTHTHALSLFLSYTMAGEGQRRWKRKTNVTGWWRPIGCLIS